MNNHVYFCECVWGRKREREGERENLREGENVVVEDNLLKEKARR